MSCCHGGRGRLVWLPAVLGHRNEYVAAQYVFASAACDVCHFYLHRRLFEATDAVGGKSLLSTITAALRGASKRAESMK